MSSLRLLPQIGVPPIEPRGRDESFLAETVCRSAQARLAEMQRDLAEHEELDVVAFLPSGKPFLWKSWAMPIRHSPHLAAGRQGSGRACTLLAHQSSIQVLVSIESIPAGSQRRVVTFEAR